MEEDPCLGRCEQARPGAGHSYPDEEGQSVLDRAYPGVEAVHREAVHREAVHRDGGGGDNTDQACTLSRGEMAAPMFPGDGLPVARSCYYMGAWVLEVGHGAEGIPVCHNVQGEDDALVSEDVAGRWGSSRDVDQPNVAGLHDECREGLHVVRQEGLHAVLAEIGPAGDGPQSREVVGGPGNSVEADHVVDHGHLWDLHDVVACGSHTAHDASRQDVAAARGDHVGVGHGVQGGVEEGDDRRVAHVGGMVAAGHAYCAVAES